MRGNDSTEAAQGSPQSSRLSSFSFLFLAALLATALLAPGASADPPSHARAKALDVTGLNKACGVATDTKGDLYASSAGADEIKVHGPAPTHSLLATIANANEPCGLAVTTTGALYVSEQATGEVVRYKPDAYPLTGTPVYGAREVIDASGEAKGIAVDPFDNALYVAEGTHVEAYVHELQIVGLSGVTGGTFKLKFEGPETASLPYNASAAEVQGALEALSTIGAGNVEVATSSSDFFVFFIGKFAYADVPTMNRDPSSLTGVNPQIAVIEASKGFNGQIGEGSLTEATGVSAYTYTNTATDSLWRTYLSVADAAGDAVKVFSGRTLTTLELRRTIAGVDHDDDPGTPDQQFGFGASGAYLAADPGNESTEHKCDQVEVPPKGPQACTAGHFFLHDAAHGVVDEFDATGELVTQLSAAGLTDAGPTQVAVDRSAATGDGTLYVSSGASAGARLLAFEPLLMPSREALGTPLSRVLAGALGVATDCRGYVYVAAQTAVYVFGPAGQEIASIETPGKLRDVAADCDGNVYVVEIGSKENPAPLTYYTPAPGSYPPTPTTTYTRHEPPLLPDEEGIGVGSETLTAVAVNPANGHVFALGQNAVSFPQAIVEFGSIGEGSPYKGECGASLLGSSAKVDIGVYGATGEVYVGRNGRNLYALRCGAEPEVVRQFNGGGCPSGEIGQNPALAVDQSNGHVVEYATNQAGGAAREYDSAGACLAEFGVFASASGTAYKVAIDNSCALHDPPLTEQTTPKCKEEFPSDGTAYVALDSAENAVQPYDVNAFGPLEYPPPAKHKLKVKKTGTGTGTVTSSPAGIDCGLECSAEFEETKVVTLTATEGLNSEFLGFSGCEAEPSPSECEVTASEDREVTAEFKSTSTEKVPLKVTKTGAGSGTVTSSPEGIDCGSECEAEFGKDDLVTLTAEAEAGFEFLGWSGCDDEPTASECEVTMTEAREVEAEFDVEHPTLSLAKEGSGKGAVTSSPAGIACGATCAAKFDLGEEVTLAANADPGSVFEGWKGCDAEPSAGECEVTMTEAREVTATFAALPQVIAKQALPIGYDEATLRGEVDPEGVETSYRFEYLTEAEYEENGGSFAGALFTPAKALPAGEEPVAVAAPLTGLAEGTAYRFRVVAENPIGEAEDEGTFETLERAAAQECANAEYRTGFASFLPECRAYELVSPPRTNQPPNAPSHGSGGTFFNGYLVAPRGPGAGESVGFLAGVDGADIFNYRAQRGAGDHPAGGWESEPYGLTFAQAALAFDYAGVSADQRYWLFRILDGETPTPLLFPQGAYMRVPAGTASGQCIPEPKATFEASDPEAKFEAVGCGSLGVDLDVVGRFVSPGGAHVIFTSDQELEGNSPPEGNEAIYDREAGSASAEVVSVDPDGLPFGPGEAPSYVGATEDGEAVVFEADGALYVHREGKTTQVAASPNTFAGISEDGERVFYIDTTYGNALQVPAAGLYACEVEAAPCAGPGAQAPIPIAGDAVFVNVAADGSSAYFTSEADLAAGAQAGQPNLYLWEEGTVSFLAVLDPQDLVGFRFAAGIEGVEFRVHLGRWTSAIGEAGRSRSPTRSTADGGVLVFQSHAQLTAYDNQGKGEIYRYEADAAPGQSLLCLSCDPSGAPPLASTFTAFLQLVGKNQDGVTKQDTVVPNVTDDGRAVFFQSPRQLLPEDTNQAADVYEWRAQGTTGPGGDTCQRQAGCLALISTGQNEESSVLYGMSADGHDVFFVTREKLAGGDITGTPSLYDARVLGGIPEPPPPAPCQGDACQGQGTAPPSLAVPATTGAGEGTAPATGKKPCAKGKKRVKGRCVKPKRRHLRQHRHGRRAGHEGRAQR